MMAAFGYFDPDMTPEQVARRRQVIEAMMGGFGRASTIGEGIGDAMRGIAVGIQNRRLNEAEGAGRASAGKVFGDVIGRAFNDAPVSSAPTMAAAAAPSGDSADMESRIYQGLVQRGMPDHVARGAIANKIAESRLDPGINEANPIVPGSRGGFGLNQWTGPRRRAYEAFAQQRGVPVDDLDTQLDFTMHEMEGPESAAWKALLGTQTAEEAARVYSDRFLRPGIPHMDRRLAEARRLVGVDFGGEQQVADVSPQREMVAAAQQIAQAPVDGFGLAQDQAGFPPAPQPVPAQAGSDLSAQELIEAASNPWLTDGQRQVLNVLLQQRMRAMDPMRQLEMQRLEQEILTGAPDYIAPVDRQRLDMDRQRLGLDREDMQADNQLARERFDFERNQPITVPGSSRLATLSGEVLLDAQPEPGYALLTPEQAQTMGLPEGERWQVSPNGQIKPVSGSQTTVNVNTEGDTAWEKESAKLFAQRYDTLTTQAQSAQQMLGLYDIAQSALDAGMRTGVMGGGEQAVRQLGLVMGIGDADKVAGAELLTSVTNRMALQMRNPDSGMGMPGAVSDRDLRFLKDAQIGLDRSPEGNRRMLEAFRALEQRKVEVAALADQYIEQNGRLDVGFNKMVREYAETNPMFDERASADVPEGIDPGVWEVMTPEERALWRN